MPKARYNACVLQHLTYACLLVFATTVIHASCTAATLSWVRSLASHGWPLRNSVTRASVLFALVFCMTLAAWFEAAVWASAYWLLEALPSFGDALYFSMVTFTTLGYGDVTLAKEWRMLGALQAANGIVIFGWTTALIVAAVQRLFLHHPPQEERS